MNLQTKAYSHYIKKQYPECINLYTECLKQPNISPIIQLHIQATLCIIHMHLHNYTQAYHCLQQLQSKLINYKKKYIGDNFKNSTNLNNNQLNKTNQNINISNNSTNISNNLNKEQLMQYYLIYIKVQLCLMLIQLINSNHQHVLQYLNNILIVFDTFNSNKGNMNNDGYILWNSFMFMLFQVGSFRELYMRVEKILNNYGKEDAMQNQNHDNSFIQISPILLTSLSFIISLTSNNQLAYKLQYYCHQLLYTTPTPQIIPTLISCKHLLTLTQKLGYNAHQAYKVEFNKLMNTPEIYGISQQTLFRGYEEKIQIGKDIVNKLIKQERKMGNNNQDNQNKWLYGRVIYKLQQYLYQIQQNPNQSLSNQIPKQTLINTLNSLSSNLGPQILSYMLNSKLVQNIIRQQQQKINVLIKVIKYIGVTKGWKQMIILPPRIQDNRQEERQNDKIGNNKQNGQYKYKLYKKGQNKLIKNNEDENNNEEYQIYIRQYKNYTTNGPKITPFVDPISTSKNQQRINKQKEEKQLRYQGNKQKQQRQKQLQRQRQVERQRQRQLQKQKQKQLLQNQQQIYTQQYQKYQQFRRRQDRQKYTTYSIDPIPNKLNNTSNKNENKYIQQKYNLNNKIQDEQRDLSRDDKNNVSVGVNVGEKRINRRRIQHVNVIQKSPVKYSTININKSASPSPYGRDKYSQDSNNSMIKIKNKYIGQRQDIYQRQKQRQRQRQKQITKQRQTINPTQTRNKQKLTFNYKTNNQINTSKVANHKNNVYLDSDSSRFINPLQDLQQFDNTNNDNYIHGYNKTTPNPIPSSSNINNINSKIYNKTNKLGLTSKIQRRQIAYNQQIPRIQQNNANYNTNNINYNTNKNDAGNYNQQNIMSILKNQNSRIKDTQKQLNNVNFNSYNTNFNQKQNKSQINNKNVYQNQISYQTMGKSNINQPKINNNMPNTSYINNHNSQPTNIDNYQQKRLQYQQKQRQNKQYGKMILENREDDDRNTSTFGQPQPKKNNIEGSKIIGTKQNLSAETSLMKKTDSNMINVIGNTKMQKLTPKSPSIRRLMKLCNQGQYFVKRHFSSDGGQQKFVQLSENIIKWAVDEDKINTKYQSYKLKDIKGIAYGKVTQTFLKQCNKNLLPWLCFSLIFQKRTLDFYCTDPIDPVIWIPGLTAALVGQTLSLKYPKKKNKLKGKQRQETTENVPVNLFTPGRVLWKRFLMKLQQRYIKPLKKNQKGNKGYKNPNAYAIILWNNEFNKKSKLKSQK